MFDLLWAVPLAVGLLAAGFVRWHGIPMGVIALWAVLMVPALALLSIARLFGYKPRWQGWGHFD